MIWRWLISFSALGLMAHSWATLPLSRISGTVLLRDSRVAAVAKGDYSGVVISLAPLERTPALTARRATMQQKDKTFIPHVLAIPTGSTVDFPNLDPIFHNAFSSYNGQIFDVGLYAPGTSRAVRFSRPGVVRVFCNIHSAMSALIVVLDTPWFAITGRDGSFSIPLPPGEYRLSVFHERATEATLAALGRNVAVGPEPGRLRPITISESGYLSIPHKNKYGHEYPPAAASESLYPGARQ